MLGRGFGGKGGGGRGAGPVDVEGTGLERMVGLGFDARAAAPAPASTRPQAKAQTPTQTQTQPPPHDEPQAQSRRGLRPLSLTKDILLYDDPDLGWVVEDADSDMMRPLSSRFKAFDAKSASTGVASASESESKPDAKIDWSHSDVWL